MKILPKMSGHDKILTLKMEIMIRETNLCLSL